MRSINFSLLHFYSNLPTSSRADYARMLQRRRISARWAMRSPRVALWLLDARTALLMLADGLRFIDGTSHFSDRLARLAGADYPGDILVILMTLRAIVFVNHELAGVETEWVHISSRNGRKVLLQWTPTTFYTYSRNPQKVIAGTAIQWEQQIKFLHNASRSLPSE